MPTDATTNPSLIFKASKLPEYASLVDAAVKYGKEHGKGNEKETLALVLDKLSVAFGTEIIKIIPGYVSTEVDARLSFDTEGNVKGKAHYQNVRRERGAQRSGVD